MCLDLVKAGDRLVAVGERGHVLLSDDAAKSWRQAAEVPTRTTLTALHVTDAKTLWAAGHGGVILQSTDAGEHWRIAAGKADGPDVLLAIRVEPDGRGLAVGGFGAALATRDGGKSWNAAPLLPGEAGEKHLNRIAVTAAGTWLITAEGGQVLRSTDRGDSWTAVKTPYAGSLWCALALADGSVLAGGMRGNVLRSRDDGRSWTQQAIAEAGSITAIAELGDHRVVLVGVDGTLATAAPGAEAFVFKRLDDRATLTGVVPLSTRELVLASMGGMRVVSLES
ncbi:MAG: YCF48-related protein [Burkholderiaceae bacterium]